MGVRWMHVTNLVRVPHDIILYAELLPSILVPQGLCVGVDEVHIHQMDPSYSKTKNCIR